MVYILQMVSINLRSSSTPQPAHKVKIQRMQLFVPKHFLLPGRIICPLMLGYVQSNMAAFKIGIGIRLIGSATNIKSASKVKILPPALVAMRIGPAAYPGMSMIQFDRPTQQWVRRHLHDALRNKCVLFFVQKSIFRPAPGMCVAQYFFNNLMKYSNSKSVKRVDRILITMQSYNLCEAETECQWVSQGQKATDLCEKARLPLFMATWLFLFLRAHYYRHVYQLMLLVRNKKKPLASTGCFDFRELIGQFVNEVIRRN